MDDRSYDSLDLPFDYLDLPEEDPQFYEDLTSEIPVEAVRDLGSTGELALDESGAIERIPAAVRTESAEAPVYGLHLRKPEEAQRKSFRPSPIVVGLVVLALLALLAAALFIPRVLSRNKSVITTPIPAQPAEPEVEPALAPGSIKMSIGSLAYDSTNVALAAGDVDVQVADGRVVVTHLLKSNENLDVPALVRASAQRAAALAAELSGQRVTPDADEDGADFAGLTWVVRLVDGDTFLAITEQAPADGALRHADGTYGLVAGAEGYVLSPDVLAALGDGSGLALTAGTAPTDAQGNAISAKATLPQPEPEPEAEPEEAEEEVSYADEGDSYYQDYDDSPTYSEPTYTEPTYTEPTYTEPSNDEPTYDDGNTDYDYSYSAPGDEGGSDQGSDE